MPSVEDLTNAVFNKDMIPSHGIYFEPRSDREYQRASRSITPPIEERINTLRCFLDTVRDKIAKYKKIKKGSVNYEEIYHACEKVTQSEQGHSPVSSDFTRRLATDLVTGQTEPCLLDRSNGYYGESDIDHTAQHAIRLIKGVVSSELDDENCNINGLKIIQEIIQDNRFEDVNIVTLNHDRLVERFLEGDNSDNWSHEYEDGFSNQRGEAREYKPGQIFSTDKTTRIIKPHGSVDWFLAEKEFRKSQKPKEISYIKHANQNNKRKYSLPGNGNEVYQIIGAGPFYLTGGEKEKQYADDIVGDMTYALNESLSNSEYILVSGFGWADRGMSRYLINSLRWDDNRKMVLMYEGNLSSAEDYPYLSGIYTGQRSDNISPSQITVINEYMENVDINLLNKSI